ncbi:MAG TPA: hypothetical protein VLI69_07885 [Gammaproteobacteria bacterium]|nr:hypothetical protein [Gammaproteobacteria bacterium]
MFATSIIQSSTHPKNLNGVAFNERAEVEGIVDELEKAATDPYAASLPLIASAELDDANRYSLSLSKMLVLLTQLDKTPDAFPEWMRNNSFKAWMWGRVLLAGDAVNDAPTVVKSKRKLDVLLNSGMAKNDNLAFFAWAAGYFSTLNDRTYLVYHRKMTKDAIELSNEYSIKPTHDALSNALWAWVMALPATANAQKINAYNQIKKQMTSLTFTQSVVDAIQTGLLRTADSNDYPAWALAKVRVAAAVMHDQDLYQQIDGVLTSSLANAKKAGAKAEYALGVLENQLAMLQMNKELGLQVKPLSMRQSRL